MGLRDTARKAAQQAIKAAGDTAVSVTITSGTTKSHNPVTDVMTETGGTTQPVNAVRYNREVRESDTIVRREYIAFAQADLTAPIDTEAKIEIGVAEFKIVDMEQDPAEAVWIIQIEPS